MKPKTETAFPITPALAPTIPANALAFHEDWEKVQRALGAVLMAYYYNRPAFKNAVAVAAYAVAELELHDTEAHP
jgi:hypothetical protein